MSQQIVLHKIWQSKSLLSAHLMNLLLKGNQHNINLKSKTLTSSQSLARLKLFHFKNLVTNVSKMHKLLDIPPLPRSPSIGLLTELYFHTD